MRTSKKSPVLPYLRSPRLDGSAVIVIWKVHNFTQENLEGRSIFGFLEMEREKWRKISEKIQRKMANANITIRLKKFLSITKKIQKNMRKSCRVKLKSQKNLTYEEEPFYWQNIQKYLDWCGGGRGCTVAPQGH